MLFLILTLRRRRGLYIVLSADFVAVVQVLIYAGAIAVLMMFAIMLTPAADRENSETAFQAPGADPRRARARRHRRSSRSTRTGAIADRERVRDDGGVARRGVAQAVRPAVRGRVGAAGGGDDRRDRARRRRRRTRCLPAPARARCTLEQVLVVGALLFAIGLYIALSKRNAVGVLMGIELMLNAVNLTLLAFSRFVESPRPIDGQVFAVFVITVAAAEAAVALALAVAVYRHRETVNIDEIDLLRW